MVALEVEANAFQLMVSVDFVCQFTAGGTQQLAVSVHAATLPDVFMPNAYPLTCFENRIKEQIATVVVDCYDTNLRPSASWTSPFEPMQMFQSLLLLSLRHVFIPFLPLVVGCASLHEPPINGIPVLSLRCHLQFPVAHDYLLNPTPKNNVYRLGLPRQSLQDHRHRWRAR